MILGQIKMITGKALVLTGGILHDIHAKTAHGLIRGSERFDIVGIIDPINAGRDAGEVIGEKFAGIPVYYTVSECKAEHPDVKYAIIGIATKGGVIPPDLQEFLKDSMNNGLSIVNGLHQHVADIPELAAIAHYKEVSLYDIRKPKPFIEARFWNGDILEVECPKIAVLGTDCALGKRTTARFLTEELRKENYKAEMIFTGQTGWMQGFKYGFIFDATPNDFISGELEGAILKCWREETPDFILIEGQSGLRNPSGPCGSEFIISANIDGVILQHNPERKRFKGLDHYPASIPKPSDEIKLIELLGGTVIGISINSADLTFEEAEKIKKEYENELDIPVAIPFYEGVGPLIKACKKLLK